MGRRCKIAGALHDEFLRLYGAGLADADIGSKLGVAKKTVLNYRKRLGLPQRWRERTDKRYTDAVKRLGPCTREEIAKEVGRNFVGVYLLYRLIAAGVLARTKVYRPGKRYPCFVYHDPSLVVEGAAREGGRRGE